MFILPHFRPNKDLSTRLSYDLVAYILSFSTVFVLRHVVRRCLCCHCSSRFWTLEASGHLVCLISHLTSHSWHDGQAAGWSAVDGRMGWVTDPTDGVEHLLVLFFPLFTSLQRTLLLNQKDLKTSMIAMSRVLNFASAGVFLACGDSDELFCWLENVLTFVQ